MDADTAIVRPVVGRKSPRLGPLAVMVSSGADLHRLRGSLPLTEHPVRLMMSRLYLGPDTPDGIRYAAAGPVVGAPYAVMLMEPMIAWGASQILFVGWCGAISPRVAIGDIILPTGAVIDEGTSPAYGAAPMETAHPSAALHERFASALATRGGSAHHGKIWSTDAIYRETPRKVARFQALDALAVEMELSAIFTVARYRGVQAAAAVVVSDELTSLTWKPGFKDPRFRESRSLLIEVIKDLCQNPP